MEVDNIVVHDLRSHSARDGEHMKRLNRPCVQTHWKGGGLRPPPLQLDDFRPGIFIAYLRQYGRIDQIGFATGMGTSSEDLLGLVDLVSAHLGRPSARFLPRHVELSAVPLGNNHKIQNGFSTGHAPVCRSGVGGGRVCRTVVWSGRRAGGRRAGGVAQR